MAEPEAMAESEVNEAVEPESAEDDGLDEDGLQIQKYVSMVLVVVPDEDYMEQTLRHARSSLYNIHVGTRSVAADTESLLQGRLQDEFMVDGPLADASLSGYEGVIFVGGAGALALCNNEHALRLAREATLENKMIGAWGHSVAILAAAGVLKGRKVAGDPSVKDAVKKAGGKYSSRQIMLDDRLVTCRDESAGMRFGKTLAQVIAIGIVGA